MHSIWDLIRHWLMTQGLTFARNLIVFALIMLAGWIAARVAGRAVKGALDRSHRLKPSPLLSRFIVNVVSKSIFLIALLVALADLGINTGALIASLGASGLVLGFALRDTLSNFASGTLILLYRPFEVDHFVEVGGQSGTVSDLTLVATVLSTPEGKVITIPNSKVWGNPITNFSATPTRRFDVAVGIAYDASIGQAEEVFGDILTGHDKILADPAPQILLTELGDSAVVFTLRGWVNNADFAGVQNDLLHRGKERLDAEGIGLPFPQREVWVHELSEG